MNYENDIKIDEFQLDREWIKQSTLFMKYAKEAADADSKRKRAKEKLEVTRAEVDLDYRKDPPEGLKVTEKVIEGLVKTDERYEKAFEEYQTAEYEYSILSAAVRAIEQKKSALENLVKLQLGGYFSEPKEEVNNEEKVDDRIERLDREQRNKLNQRRRKRKVNND